MNTENMKSINRLQMELQDSSVKALKWNTCLNCDRWIKRTVIDSVSNPGQTVKFEQFECSLFKAMPPPHIILLGCEEHISDDIPF